MSQRRHWALAGLVLTCLVGFGLWRALASATRSREPTAPTLSARSAQGPPSTHPNQPIAQMERWQMQHFALLRTPPEGLPASMLRILRGPKFIVNTTLAQRMPVRSKGRFWVIPGAGILCIFTQSNRHSVGSVCAKTGYVLTHGLALTLLSPAASGGRTIVGVAPDGAREELLYTGHTRDVAPIMHNVFTRTDSVHIQVDRVSFR